MQQNLSTCNSSLCEYHTAKKIVAKNSDVKLIVSIGSSGGDIVAPDVTGKQFDEAIAEILELELNYTVLRKNLMMYRRDM